MNCVAQCRQFAILGRARVTPSDRKISAARKKLAAGRAKSCKLDGATAGKIRVLTAMLLHPVLTTALTALRSQC